VAGAWAPPRRPPPAPAAPPLALQFGNVADALALEEDVAEHSGAGSDMSSAALSDYF